MNGPAWERNAERPLLAGVAYTYCIAPRCRAACILFPSLNCV